MATATLTRTKIRPLDDRVLVKPSEAEEKTKSGIFFARRRKGEADDGQSHRRRAWQVE